MANTYFHKSMDSILMVFDKIRFFFFIYVLTYYNIFFYSLPYRICHEIIRLCLLEIQASTLQAHSITHIVMVVVVVCWYSRLTKKKFQQKLEHSQTYRGKLVIFKTWLIFIIPAPQLHLPVPVHPIYLYTYALTPFIR